jgi:Siphovirus Gp157
MSHLALAAFQHNEMRRRIRAEDPDLDEETLADTGEGLTDLHEIIAAIVRSALRDEALVSGLKGRIAEMQGRLERLQDRASKRRQIARDVMLETEIKKISAPDFTLSVRPGTPGVVIVDEGAIPQTFWEPRDPRLNRQALITELKQGAAIAGVQLSNPEPVLSVRTR